MSVQDFAITAGTSVDKIIDPFDPRNLNCTITLTGRLTGVVQIKIISRNGDTYFSPSGSSSIDLTTTDTLIITGTAVKAVRIDDTANVGAALKATVETY